MECPKCEGEVVVIHADPIECSDCGATMVIEYCFCQNCGYGFRRKNGEFLDEMDVNESTLEDAIDELEELLEDDWEEVWEAHNSAHVGSMLDLITPCVKCGSNMTAYDEGLSEYECLECGFRWEILKNG